MTTSWSSTDRVWYCDLHDSLVRNLAMQESPETAQCDWARFTNVPIEVEKCWIRVADLIVHPKEAQ